VAVAETPLVDRIALAVADSGLTQDHLARIIGCAQSGVSQRLHGKVSWRVNELTLLSRALDMPLSELLGDGAGSSPRQREGSTPFNRQDGRKQKGTGRTLGPRTPKPSGKATP
jgi:transcriptional regulator with XRE-family HTH domain